MLPSGYHSNRDLLLRMMSYKELVPLRLAESFPVNTAWISKVGSRLGLLTLQSRASAMPLASESR